MNQPVLRTERLTLRPFEPKDAVALHAFFSDAAATRFWSDPHVSLEESRAFVDGTIAADPAETCDFIIDLDGEVIGKAGMWKRPEIGIFVLPAYQRRGYACEALTAILPHLFSAYDVTLLTADVDPRNEPSIGLLTSLGFVETHRAQRTIEVQGEWCDSVYFACPRPDG